jgi:hypothetical protein
LSVEPEFIKLFPSNLTFHLLRAIWRISPHFILGQNHLLSLGPNFHLTNFFLPLSFVPKNNTTAMMAADGWHGGAAALLFY